MFLPEEDKFTYRQRELTDQLCVAMGGRVAEEITFGNVTNGAVGDIRMATNIARKMVCEWGMSEDLGMVEYGEGEARYSLPVIWANRRDTLKKPLARLMQRSRSLLMIPTH